MSSEPSDPDLDALANEVAKRLEPGPYGDKMLLSRRQLMAIAGAGVSAGALGTLGVTEAEAQSVVGQIGTDQERVDVWGGTGDFQKLSAASSFTDPAGIEHTGELADIDDVDGGMSGVVDASTYSGTTGGAQIQNAIDDVDSQGGHNVIYVGPVGPDTNQRWDLASTITIPSNTTLLLWGPHIRLQNGVDDNIFRNANARSGDSTRDSNIQIIGDGGAYLDGNGSNQTRANKDDSGMVGVNLHKVDSFRLEGFKIGPTNAWAIKPENVNFGLARDIELAQDGSTANQDGIHFVGAENCFATEFTGKAGDDMVAVEASGIAEFSEDPTNAGDTRNVVATDFFIEDLDRSGIRTIGDSGYVCESIYISNIVKYGGGNGGFLKIGWSETNPAPSEHKDIVIDGVRGTSPSDNRYLGVESGVQDLTIKSPRGTASGSAVGIEGTYETIRVNLVDWGQLDQNVSLPTDWMWNGTYIQSSTPSNPAENAEWIDTS